MIPLSDKKLKIKILLLVNSRIKLMGITKQAINYSRAAIAVTVKYRIIQTLPLLEIPFLVVTNLRKVILKLI